MFGYNLDMMNRKSKLLIDTEEAKKLFSATSFSLQELKKVDKDLKTKIEQGYVAGGYDILNVIDKLRSFSTTIDISFYKEMFIKYLEKVVLEFIIKVLEDKKDLIKKYFTEEEVKQINNILLVKKEKERVDFDHV